MDTDPVTRFLHALSPASREEAEGLSREELAEMAEAWEGYLRNDTSLLTVDEIDPPMSEHEAAEHVVRDRSGGA
ncbi:hypothetical protein [Streptomyces sp. NPDC089799]|uniref:hypothetical protein n=1 Tax=Streptomyces sp. NPDC089799 TaxID=3155066 RepID=UPI00342AE4B6